MRIKRNKFDIYVFIIKKKPRVNSGVPEKSVISAPIVARAMLHSVKVVYKVKGPK